LLGLRNKREHHSIDIVGQLLQMEMEIEELRRQRDQAQTQVDELRRKLQEDQQVCVSVSLCLTLTEI